MGGGCVGPSTPLQTLTAPQHPPARPQEPQPKTCLTIMAVAVPRLALFSIFSAFYRLTRIIYSRGLAQRLHHVVTASVGVLEVYLRHNNEKC